MRYRSGIDRQTGMYLCFLVVAIVGAGAALVILKAIWSTDWSSDSKYESLILDPFKAEIPDR